MNDVLFQSPCLPCGAPSPRGPNFWARLRQGLSLSERDTYFAKATDCADLERRQRAWERGSGDMQRLSLQSWS